VTVTKYNVSVRFIANLFGWGTGIRTGEDDNDPKLSISRMRPAVAVFSTMLCSGSRLGSKGVNSLQHFVLFMISSDRKESLIR
jgi:hypothetical protein